MSGHNAWMRQKPCLLPVTSGLLPLIQDRSLLAFLGVSVFVFTW